MIGDPFTDQTIPDSRAYVSNKVLGMKQVTRKRRVARKRVSDPAGKCNYIYVGSKAWNERYLEYEWNGHEFGEKRQRHLPGYLNTVEKRCEMRRNKAFERFDRKVSQGRLSDVIVSSLGYALTYYHTVEGDMYKEWMNKKRIKKGFRLDEEKINHCCFTYLIITVKRKWNRSTSYSMKAVSSMTS